MTITAELRDLVSLLLSKFGDRPYVEPENYTHDAGPAVLAGAACAAGLVTRELAAGALGRWLEWFAEPPPSTALIGGLSALYLGARAAADLSPSFASLSRGLRDALTRVDPRACWRSREPLWHDYDLISGPSGSILALAADLGCAEEDVLPAARHLAALCARDDLDGLRVGGYQDDPLRGWNFRRINTGLAHGAGGVVAALSAACATGPAARAELSPALRRAAGWLRGEAFVDDRGLTTWATAGRDGAPRPAGAARRQAWCYGTPGLAWTLWDAARVLDDGSLGVFAEDAMRSFAAAFDPDYYLDPGPDEDALGVCHGLAGTLAVSDAFARHAGLLEAESLAERLEAMLRRRTAEVVRLGAGNMTLLSGASGVLCAALTRATGYRDWMRPFALR